VLPVSVQSDILFFMRLECHARFEMLGFCRRSNVARHSYFEVTTFARGFTRYTRWEQPKDGRSIGALDERFTIIGFSWSFGSRLSSIFFFWECGLGTRRLASELLRERDIYLGKRFGGS